MNRDELQNLLKDNESDRVERKESLSDKKKICQTICAFANDMPNHGRPGYLFVGARDNGIPTGLPVTDRLLLELSSIRSDGNILPFPTMNVQKHTFDNKDLAVVEVFPCDSPPVRYKGQVWIRIGPRLAVATEEAERRLCEKRSYGNLTFGRRPMPGATMAELNIALFRNEYLPFAVDATILEENQRTVNEQLTSMRFMATPDGPATAAGLLVVGKDPQFWLPGAYVQFLRVDGNDLTAPIKNQREIAGTLHHQLRLLDELLELNISTSILIPERGPELQLPDYPLIALQQLVRNAIMHRNYETSNAPVRVYWYSNRVEISNPGGLYGIVTAENFSRTNDYRNPQIAEAMKTLGFVQRFGIGIQLVQKALQENGNPPAEFHFEPTNFQVTLRSRP